MVFLEWGAVEVRGVGDGRRVYWTFPPRTKTIRCGTVERAKVYAKTAIARRRNHRYELLAGKIATRRQTAERSAEFEQALATILYVDMSVYRKGCTAGRFALDTGDESLLRRGP